MVFCNKNIGDKMMIVMKGHNPYFNRWFSAIRLAKFNDDFEKGHNPYFNRWFSAIYFFTAG